VRAATPAARGPANDDQLDAEEDRDENERDGDDTRNDQEPFSEVEVA
jgi:hypothetical protein